MTLSVKTLFRRISRVTYIRWTLTDISKYCIKKLLSIIKKAPLNLKTDLNKEAELLASKLKIDDRIEKINTKNYFIIFKDHKSDFRSSPACKLINPFKMQMGEISKVILQDICATLRISFKYKSMIVSSGLRTMTKMRNASL